jgi:dehydrogenase/reductase SDR family member 7B
MQYFQNKVIWITGASSGIGEALAHALSAAGARLILSSRRAEELERVKAASAHPENTKILTLDLEDIPSRKTKTAQAIALFGQIDIMFHNGGISQRSLVKDTSMEVQRKLMEVDHFSYVELTNHLLPHFIERRSGHFVVISSVMGKIGTPMRSAYAAAKHALHGFFDCLRAEVADQNIRVTIITPGYIRTQIALHAVTGTGSKLGVLGKDIEQGYPAEKAATQILQAVADGKFESYAGKNGREKLALTINRFAPALFKKLAPKQVPK